MHLHFDVLGFVYNYFAHLHLWRSRTPALFFVCWAFVHHLLPRAPPSLLILHPMFFVGVVFLGLILFTDCTPISTKYTLFTSWTSHVIHTPSYFRFPLLSLLNNFILLFILLYIKTKGKKNKYIWKLSKLQKIYKKSKKLKMFSFILLCLCTVACTVWHLFSKNTKNNFHSLLVLVLPLASRDTYFQVIKKYKKNINFQKYKNINIFNQKSILRTTWSLLLRCKIRRNKVSPCQVHLQKIKSFS